MECSLRARPHGKWPRLRRRALALATCLATAALVASAVSPSWAATPASDPGAGSAVVGSFALGDQLEATVGERDGSFTFQLPVAGVTLGWDSRAIGSNRNGLGHGFGWGLGHIERDGGVQVYAASGGVYSPDPTHPSGLAGYGVEDLVFEQREGELPARPEAGVGPVAYAYVLHELGAKTTYYNDAGDPVATVDGFGHVSSWLWDELVPHRLVALVDSDGVRTNLDWDRAPGSIVVDRGVNLPDHDAAGAWSIELDGGRVDAIVDPEGGRVSLGYEADTGLLEGVGGVSGGTTQIAWKTGDDNVPRVSSVRTVDAAGAELSVRTWAPAGGSTPSSGWPVFQGGEGDVFWSGDPAFRYQTVMADGPTRVVSEYNSLHVLVNRKMIVTTGSGDHELQAQAHAYFGAQDGDFPDPEALPGNWSRPAVSEVTHRNTQGGARTSRETFEFDDAGRRTVWTAEDGTVTVTEYDHEIPGEAKLPVGLALSETVTAPDGQVMSTRHDLNDDRTAIVATEVVARTGNGPETVTSRTEFEVRDDGVVVEERRYPDGDTTTTPVVTKKDDVLDLAAGTRTISETTAAGTPAEATASEIVSLRHGGPVEQTDVAGNSTITEYDALGRPTATTDALERVSEATYETAQRDGRNATTVLGPDGVAVTEVTDPLARIVSVSDNVDHGTAKPGHVRSVETREYPEPGLVRVTDAWGATTETRYDVLGRVVRTTSPGGLSQVTDYDDVARTETSGLTPTGLLADAPMTTTEVRDTGDRVTSTTGRRVDDLPVATTETTYDGFGRPIASSDGRRDTRIELNAAGDPVSETYSPAADRHAARAGDDGIDVITADRQFDGFGQSVERTVSGYGDSRSGGTRRFDELGRVVGQIDQLGRETTYTHTVDGLVAEVHAGSGQVMKTTHDDRTRLPILTEISSPVGEDVRTAIDYDPVTDRETRVYDPDRPDETQIRTTYDALGNVLTVTYPDGKQIRHEYDLHGRKLATIDVAENRTEYSWDEDGRQQAATQVDAAGVALASVAYEYDAFGRVSALHRDNGVTTTFTFTSASEIASERTENGATLLALRAYTYDAHGNLTQRTDTTGEAEDDSDLAQQTVTTVYEYDAHSRLIRSTEHSGADADAPVTEDTRYELNASDDVVAETITTTHPETGEQSTRNRVFEYGPRGELASIAVTEGDDTVIVETQDYDEAGNLTRAADGTVRTYDAGNRPTSTTSSDGQVTTIGYWADGTRMSLTASSLEHTAETRFYWDDTALLNDVHVTDGDERVASYLIGATRHARTTTGTDGTSTGHYVADRHANVMELTDADGAVAAQYRYSDYGTRSTIVPGTPDPDADARPRVGDADRNPFGHAGEYVNPDGTQHLAVRTYDTEQLRFTTMDTAELHNVYAFADLNPIMNIDPTGRSAQTDRGVDWAAIGMALAGSILTAISSAIVPVAGTALGLYLTGLAFGVVASATALVRHSVPDIPETISEAMEFFETIAGAVALLIGIGTVVRTVALVGKVTVLPEWAKNAQSYLVSRRGLELELTGFRSSINGERGLTMSWAMHQHVVTTQREVAQSVRELEGLVAQVPTKIWQQMQAGAPSIKWNGYTAWATNFKAAARSLDAMVEGAAAKGAEIQKVGGNADVLWDAIRERIGSAAKDSFKGRDASWTTRTRLLAEDRSSSASTEATVSEPAPRPRSNSARY